MEESIKQLKIFSRNGDNENFVKRAKSMEKRLDKMDKITRPNDKKDNMKINIINNSKQSKEVILIKEGKKSINNRLLFENVNLLIEKEEKVALIGENGSGKSTLIKIILGEEFLDSGVLKVSNSSKIGYLPQQIDFEDDEKTILDWFREDINILEGKAREYLSKYMFYSEDVFKKLKSLSGGEKSRLKLSKILYFEVNLLILDEPTNHLDIDSIKKLEKRIILNSNPIVAENKVNNKIDESKTKTSETNKSSIKTNKKLNFKEIRLTSTR
ncbi:MAG: ATP-binding cassette domain-containing protein, partial [Terrisporobacter sp.]